jgi:hypothetical protein
MRMNSLTVARRTRTMGARSKRASIEQVDIGGKVE